MRISDWSSDVCSSDLRQGGDPGALQESQRREQWPHRADPYRCRPLATGQAQAARWIGCSRSGRLDRMHSARNVRLSRPSCDNGHVPAAVPALIGVKLRSEEHTSELQSLMRISYAVFCLKKN